MGEKSFMAFFPRMEYATQLATHPNIKSSPFSSLKFKTSKILPFEITIKAPVKERHNPIILLKLSDSLKNRAAQRVMKIGLVAIINEAWFAWIYLSPKKKKRL